MEEVEDEDLYTPASLPRHIVSRYESKYYGYMHVLVGQAEKSPPSLWPSTVAIENLE